MTGFSSCMKFDNIALPCATIQEHIKCMRRRYAKIVPRRLVNLFVNEASDCVSMMS
jgi:hypothetical protein